jgi:hypothetical protein
VRAVEASGSRTAVKTIRAACTSFRLPDGWDGGSLREIGGAGGAPDLRGVLSSPTDKEAAETSFFRGIYSEAEVRQTELARGDTEAGKRSQSPERADGLRSGPRLPARSTPRSLRQSLTARPGETPEDARSTVGGPLRRRIARSTWRDFGGSSPDAPSTWTAHAVRRQGTSPSSSPHPADTIPSPASLGTLRRLSLGLGNP